MELEEERKSLARWESLTTSMEQALARQHESLKTLKESAARKEASLQEKARQLEAAQAALTPRCRRRSRRQPGSCRRTSAWGPSESSTGRAKQAQLWFQLE